jgi:redox-sensitive bicupin YhaK (pirin superfamily)
MPTAEMLRDGGLMHGVQLWVNLPRADKLTKPRYQDLAAEHLTFVRTHDGKGFVRVVAGDFGGFAGPGSTHTPIVYAHATLDTDARIAVPWPADWNALVYVLRGRVSIGNRAVGSHELAVLGAGAVVALTADEPTDVLFLGGQPIREPIAWYGPFVMNTKQEIIEAIDDFEAGRLGSIVPDRVTS